MTTKNQTPSHANKAQTVAEFLEMQFNLCGKSQRQIADEAGIQNPNVLTMIKQGRTKLPLYRIGAIAKAIDVDSLYLFKLAMQEYQPDTWEAIQQYVLKQPFVTENEMDIIEVVRQADVQNPKIRTESEKIKLIAVINKLKPDNSSKDD